MPDPQRRGAGAGLARGAIRHRARRRALGDGARHPRAAGAGDRARQRLVTRKRVAVSLAGEIATYKMPTGNRRGIGVSLSTIGMRAMRAAWVPGLFGALAMPAAGQGGVGSAGSP